MSNHDILNVIITLVMGMNLTFSFIALTTPKPILTSLATPKRNTQFIFASKTGELHQWIVFYEFKFPFMHYFFFHTFFDLLFQSITIRFTFQFVFPETVFTNDMIFTFTTFKIDIANAKDSTFWTTKLAFKKSLFLS